MNNFWLSGSVIRGCLALFLISSAPVAAIEIEYGGSVGVEHTNNTRRDDNNELSDTVALAAIDFSLIASEGRFNADIRGSLQGKNYRRKIFRDELIPGLNAKVLFTILPQRLTWSIEDRFGQIILDTREALTPGNRQDHNYFSTGPELRFKLTRTVDFILGSRFVSSNFENKSINNERVNGTVSIKRKLAADRFVSVNLSTERVEFDDALTNSNYDRQEGFVRFSSSVSRSNVSLDLGATALHDRFETENGFLARFAVARQLSGDRSIVFRADTQFSDAGNIFRDQLNFASDLGSVEDTLPSADPFRNNFASIEYQTEVGRFNMALAGNWNEEKYETQNNFDRKRTSIIAELDYPVSSKTNIRIKGIFSNGEFSNTNREDDDRTIELSSQYGFTENVGVLTELGYYERLSNVDKSEFRDIRGRISLFYRRRK